MDNHKIYYLFNGVVQNNKIVKINDSTDEVNDGIIEDKTEKNILYILNTKQI